MIGLRFPRFPVVLALSGMLVAAAGGCAHGTRTATDGSSSGLANARWLAPRAERVIRIDRHGALVDLGSVHRDEDVQVRVIIAADEVHVRLAARRYDGTGLAHPAITVEGGRTGTVISGQGSVFVGYAGIVEAPGAIGARVTGIVSLDSTASALVLGDGAVVASVRIDGAAGDGIRTATAAALDDVLVERCSAGGIVAGPRASIGRARVLANNGVGITAGPGSRIELALVANNAAGIEAARGTTILDSTVVSNAGTGIDASYSCLIDSCAVELNDGDGVRVDDGSLVTTCTSNDNSGAGLVTGQGCRVVELAARSNVRVGMVLGAGTSASGCAVSNGFLGLRIAGPGVALRDVHSHANAFAIEGWPDVGECTATASRVAERLD